MGTMVEHLDERPSWDVEVRRVEAGRRVTAAWLLRYRSERTRQEYAADLRRWQEWCRTHGIDPFDAERGHLDAWARDMETTSAAASVRRRVSAVSSWYGALEADGLVDRNPAAGVRRPRVDTRTGTTEAATTDQLAAMIRAGDELGPDASALVRLLAELGLRISEACAIQPGDVATTPSGAHLLRVRRKGGWVDTRPVSADLGGRLLELVGARRAERGRALLRSATGGDLNREGGRWLLRQVCRRAGLDEHVHPHMIRVWAITTALDADGVQLHDVQDFAGHADSRTTLRYDRARRRRAGVIAGALAEVIAAAERSAGEGALEPAGP